MCEWVCVHVFARVMYIRVQVIEQSICLTSAVAVRVNAKLYELYELISAVDVRVNAKLYEL